MNMMANVLEYVRAHPGAHQPEIASAHGVPTNRVAATLSDLKHQGLVINKRRGYWWPADDADTTPYRPAGDARRLRDRERALFDLIRDYPAVDIGLLCLECGLGTEDHGNTVRRLMERKLVRRVARGRYEVAGEWREPRHTKRGKRPAPPAKPAPVPTADLDKLRADVNALMAAGSSLWGTFGGVKTKLRDHAEQLAAIARDVAEIKERALAAVESCAAAERSRMEGLRRFMAARERDEAEQATEAQPKPKFWHRVFPNGHGG